MEENNKLQIANHKTCPSFFDGQITKSNDQNYKERNALNIKEQWTSFGIWCLEFEIFPPKNGGQAL
jgi:hypothetical protein